VPRERFGSSVDALESIYQHTSTPFNLIYVDGNSPPAVAKALAAQSKRRNFELIRKNQFLVPNHARNMALAKVRTKYVVFMDNDVFVTPGWLERLIDCAEQTEASIVSPVYLEGKLEDRIVHMANAISRIDKRSTGDYYIEKRLHAGKKLDDVQANLVRETTDLFEFHCALMRTDLFLIPDLMPDDISNLEHSHLSMRVLKLGHTLYFEPSSVVTYDYTYPFVLSDLPFFYFRWGQALSVKCLNFFKEYWKLADDDPFFPDAEKWVADHRRVPRFGDQAKRKVAGPNPASVLERAFFKCYREYANYVNTRNFLSKV
jgi:glycosyltransferase involved in cell wall biosynthesis